MLKEFKAFLFRGSLLDLAVAVVIGLAFAAVINSLVVNLITPLIAAILGESGLGALTFTVNEAVFSYGQFLDDVIVFVITAAAVFFFVVRPAGRLMERMRRGGGPDATTRACPECLSVIPMGATRCAFCTAVVPAA